MDMNKQTYSLEFSFDISAGTIKLLDRNDALVDKIIDPELFVERCQNRECDLTSKLQIDKTANEVLKVTQNAIKKITQPSKGCLLSVDTDFKNIIDRVDIIDVVYPGYNLWYDRDGDISALCETLIVVDIFTTQNASIDDIRLYQMLCSSTVDELKNAGLGDKITWFDFDF